jgi:hypothetical protein
MGMSTDESRLAPLLIDGDMLERMARAVARVQERFHRCTEALEAANVPYAVADDLAVATWVARVDESCVRNTPDVDILLTRSDLYAANVALSAAGFDSRIINDTQFFVDSLGAGPRDAVHIMFAGESVRPGDLAVAPDVCESEPGPGFRVLALEPLVKMLLVSFRSKDRMHLRDMIDVGLVDETWLPRLSAELSLRLKELLDNPEG